MWGNHVYYCSSACAALGSKGVSPRTDQLVPITAVVREHVWHLSHSNPGSLEGASRAHVLTEFPRSRVRCEQSCLLGPPQPRKDTRRIGSHHITVHTVSRHWSSKPEYDWDFPISDNFLSSNRSCLTLRTLDMLEVLWSPWPMAQEGKTSQPPLTLSVKRCSTNGQSI